MSAVSAADSGTADDVTRDADEVERHPCPRCDVPPGSPCRSRSGAYHPAASPGFPGSPNGSAFKLPPTAGQAGRGGPAHRRPPPPTPTGPRPTSASATLAAPPSPRSSSPNWTP
ncbi:zinc finger domain-containing protein [Streptosporangium sandarakinum]|uniref:zinc finger domain-containing protein n=1 Tax=Streptosporangium sandarakinum TaxID=1260955 RepID=UPI003D90ACD8